ncbi:MAG TPA: hypothetical protein VJR58_26655 [Vineibacter sp.]|nr:hypothetical protein [Vineibacter sp.]
MTDRSSTKTALAQGKFIRSPDRRRVEAEARALRAEAIQDVAQAVAATVRGWLARYAGAANARSI